MGNKWHIVVSQQITFEWISESRSESGNSVFIHSLQKKFLIQDTWKNILKDTIWKGYHYQHESGFLPYICYSQGEKRHNFCLQGYHKGLLVVKK